MASTAYFSQFATLKLKKIPFQNLFSCNYQNKLFTLKHKCKNKLILKLFMLKNVNFIGSLIYGNRENIQSRFQPALTSKWNKFLPLPVDWTLYLPEPGYEFRFAEQDITPFYHIWSHLFKLISCCCCCSMENQYNYIFSSLVLLFFSVLPKF